MFRGTSNLGGDGITRTKVRAGTGEEANAEGASGGGAANANAASDTPSKGILGTYRHGSKYN